jgi:ketosteroid isomerase-like protein
MDHLINKVPATDGAGEIAAAVRALTDKEAIRDLVRAYCQAIDRQDFVKLRELYHPDAGDEHGCNPSGTAQEFLTMLPGMMGTAKVCQHNITNHYIKLDGDHAEGEAYLVAYHVIEAAGGIEAFVMGGRYLDRYSRREDGVWRFAHRKVVREWVRHAPLDSISPEAPETGGMVDGIAGDHDPAYAFFTLFRRGER